MKLFLSSYLLGNEPSEFANLFANNKKVAIMLNAGDIYNPAKRPDYLHSEITALARIGLEGEELDLRDYFDSREALGVKLREYGGVWALGGNSFVLRRAMYQSGFDRAITPLVLNDNFVYGGFSAGAVVVCKTLKGIELVDDPTQIPEGYDPEIIWDGVGLYEKSVAPHYRSDHPESANIDKIVAYFEDKQMPYVTLHDGEAIVIDS